MLNITDVKCRQLTAEIIEINSIKGTKLFIHDVTPVLFMFSLPTVPFMAYSCAHFSEKCANIRQNHFLWDLILASLKPVYVIPPFPLKNWIYVNKGKSLCVREREGWPDLNRRVKYMLSDRQPATRDQS